MRPDAPSSNERIWAIVPAAGRGTRLANRGTEGDSTEPDPCKQLRDVAGQPMLTRVLDALDAAAIVGTVTVLNPQVAAIIQTLRPADARRRYAINDRPDSEMIESIQMGLQAALAWSAELPATPGLATGYLICPGDHPCITSAAINQCIDAFFGNPSRLVIAACEGRRGHPLVLPADLARDVISWPPTRGLNELRARHPDRVRIVDITDPGVLIDVDTPADLEKAREHASRSGAPGWPPMNL